MTSFLVALCVLVALALAGYGVFRALFVSMPSAEKMASVPRASEARVRAHVDMLAGAIGERTVAVDSALEQAARYIEQTLRASGYSPERQSFRADGVAVSNIIAELPGLTERILVVGAHYDSVDGTPGADDNASGVAAVLELARLMAGSKLQQSVRFVFFVNEEPPNFKTSTMGSLVYARSVRNQPISAALSIETIGYFRDEKGSQHYPAPLSLFYPSEGNFIAFVGNLRSRSLVRRCVQLFRQHGVVPSQGAALPEMIDPIGWSDHWSFWQIGVPALMVTDTAPFRNPNYHRRSDLPPTLDYHRLAGTVDGLEHVVRGLASH